MTGNEASAHAGRGERIGRYVRMVAQPGQGDELAAVMLDVADGLRATAACELYVVNRSADDDDTVWITEVWADKAASDEALAGDLGQADISRVLALLAGPPELVELVPVGGPGLPL